MHRFHYISKHFKNSLKRDYFQVFSDPEEQNLENYLKKASNTYYGLFARGVLKFAVEYAITLNKTIPESWGDVKAADTEWFPKFLKRHKSLSLRKLGQQASL
jgi:hypothetical protein